MNSSQLRVFAPLVLVLGLNLISSANAGIFNMPRFVDPGKNAVGVEPEVTLTNGGGLAGNLHYTQGLTDLNNLSILLGTGTGERNFRVGGNFTFDFFPDVGNQPGIGLGLQGIYYRYKADFGQLETATVPYIHKKFHSGDGKSIEPYFALPIGPAFASGHYHWQTTVVMGGMFQDGTHTDLHFIGEVGVSVNHTESYLSAGILYQPEN